MPTNNPPPSPTPTGDQARACPDDVITAPVPQSTIPTSISEAGLSSRPQVGNSVSLPANSTQLVTNETSATISVQTEQSVPGPATEPLVPDPLTNDSPSEPTTTELEPQSMSVSSRISLPPILRAAAPVVSSSIPTIIAPPQPALNIVPPVPQGPPATRVFRDEEPAFLTSRTHSTVSIVSDVSAGRDAQIKLEEFAMEKSDGAAEMQRSNSSESLNSETEDIKYIRHVEVNPYSERHHIGGQPGLTARRIRPAVISPYLRAGSRFVGTQQAERQIYEVQVDIKYVDLAESYMCGFLKISGLTPDHPKLTTFFEGEVVGPKYSFLTNHPEWGATESIDSSHWSRFQAFRKFVSTMRNGIMPEPDQLPQDCVFMRWKEHFLVPDHRVRNIDGASFEGFYYICLNVSKGEISGIYFHARSEKFQQLMLKHVGFGGEYSSVELR